MPSYRGTPIDLLLDVRSRLEFWMGHLDDAVLMPVDTLPDALDGHPGITKDSRIVVYCQSGGRSAAAAAALTAVGYRRVIDAGGIDDARDDIV
jgi:rhodanese-related sulfurtransferase